jgi:hypothetical protein
MEMDITADRERGNCCRSSANRSLSVTRRISLLV